VNVPLNRVKSSMSFEPLGDVRTMPELGSLAMSAISFCSRRLRLEAMVAEDV